MNANDRESMRCLIRHLCKTRTVQEGKLETLVDVLEEWQDENRTMLPGHIDKVFCNYGSGRSDR